MGRNKEFDTTLVLHKAMEVFGYYGYEGTSLQHLLDGLGIARQSLYDTYGTKRDLFISALKHYVTAKSDSVISYLENSDSVRQGITGVFHEGAFILKDENKRKECFIIYSAFDRIPHDTEVAEFITKDLKRLEKVFYETLVRGQSQGEISHRQELRALACYLNYARHSMTQLAKITSDPKVLDDYVKITLSSLDK